MGQKNVIPDAEVQNPKFAFYQPTLTSQSHQNSSSTVLYSTGCTPTQNWFFPFAFLDDSARLHIC